MALGAIRHPVSFKAHRGHSKMTWLQYGWYFTPISCLYTLTFMPWHETKADPLPPLFMLCNLWTALCICVNQFTCESVWWGVSHPDSHTEDQNFMSKFKDVSERQVSKVSFIRGSFLTKKIASLINKQSQNKFNSWTTLVETYFLQYGPLLYKNTWKSYNIENLKNPWGISGRFS